MMDAYKQVKRRIDDIRDQPVDYHHLVQLNDRNAVSKLLRAYEAPVFRRCGKGAPEDAHLWVDGQDLGPVDKLDYRALYEKATVAPFGHDTETKVDPEVRDAREIAASRIQVLVDGKQWFPDVRLLPNLSVKEVKLYKLHFYSVGGHFKSHRDTLHGPDHMATAVVFLDSDFGGGELVVRKDGRRFETQEGTCVFYTDCEHEVRPVTSGLRVVLQYDLYGAYSSEFEDHCVYDDNSSEDEKPGTELKGLDTALEEYWEEDEWENLTFILRHQYSLKTMKVPQLRGFDGTLFHALKGLGYSPELHMCIVVQKDKDFGFRVVDNDLNELTQWDGEAVACFPINGELFFEQAEAYTGNESVDALSMYHSACLCIRKMKRFKDAMVQTQDPE